MMMEEVLEHDSEGIEQIEDVLMRMGKAITKEEESDDVGKEPE